MKPISLILALLLCFCLSPIARAEGETPAPTPEVFTSGDYEYILLEDGTAQIIKYTVSAADLTVPDALDGVPVTSIGDRAFSKCSSLISVTIPDSVMELGANPFADCDKLTSIIVSPDHPTLAVIDHVLFEKATRKLICYPEGKAKSSYTIPQGIEEIGAYAF